MTLMTMLHSRHTRERGIQYAASSRFHRWRLGVLDARRSLSSGAHSRKPVAGMTGRYTSAFSRHAAPEFCKFIRPKKIEGAGKTGCALHPRSRVPMHIAKNAHEHTGSAEAVRPSLRNGFTAYFVPSPARPGLFVTVIPKKLASQELDTCHWGVRTTRLRRPLQRCSSIAPSRPPLPAPTSVTMANAPLSGRDGKE